MQAILVFAPSRRDGRTMHVSEVAGGLACECDCPTCGKPLVARRGDRNVHHFGHRRSETACAEAAETAAHAYAKQLIAERRELTLPGVTVRHRGHERHVSAPRWLRFAGSFLERALGPIRPDVQLVNPDMHLLVEVLVTHACDEDKVRSIEALGRPALEIEVGRLLDMADRSRDEIDGFILHAAARRWLYTPEHDVGRGEIEAVILEMERHEGIDLARAHFNFVRAAGRLPEDTDDVERVFQRGFASTLEPATGPGTGFVWMHPVALKAHVVENFVLATSLPSFGADDVVRFLDGDRLLCGRFRNLPDGVRAAMEAEGVPAGGAEAWVASFLEAVAGILPLVPDGDGMWTLGKKLYESLSDEREFRIRHMGGGHSGRQHKPDTPLGRLARMVGELARICGTGSYDFRAWATAPLGSGHPSPAELSREGGERWRCLEREVRALMEAARIGTVPKGGDAGLPFRSALAERAQETDRHVRALLGRDPVGAERERVLSVLRHPAVRALGVEWAANVPDGRPAGEWLAKATSTPGLASREQQDLTVRYWRTAFPPGGERGDDGHIDERSFSGQVS